MDMIKHLQKWRVIMKEPEILSQINNILEEVTPRNFTDLKEKLKTEKRKQKKKLRFGFAAACLVLLLIGGATVTADQLTGTNFFYQFYLDRRREPPKSQVYLAPEQYKEISSRSVGKVVDSDELKIEVLGAVATGNVGSVMLRFTVKNAENVLKEKGIYTEGRFGFNEESGGTLFQDAQGGSIGYHYIPLNGNSGEVQFEILYTVIGKEKMTGKQYSIELAGLAFHTQEKIKGIYKKKWKIDIDFDKEVDYTKTILLDQDILLGNKYVTLTKIELTPYSCIFSFEKRTTKDSDLDIVMEELEKKSDKAIIYFPEASIDKKAFSYSISGGRADEFGNLEPDVIYCKASLFFKEPIMVDNVKNIKFNGKRYYLK